MYYSHNMAVNPQPARKSNNYDAFLEEFDVDVLDGIKKHVTCLGSEGTSLEGRITATQILGMVDIVDRKEGRYSLYNPVTKDIIHVNQNTSSQKHLLTTINDAILRQIKPYESLEQYRFIKHGLDAD